MTAAAAAIAWLGRQIGQSCPTPHATAAAAAAEVAAAVKRLLQGT